VVSLPAANLPGGPGLTLAEVSEAQKRQKRSSVAVVVLSVASTQFDLEYFGIAMSFMQNSAGIVPLLIHEAP
jgi:hypothetical protein